MKCLKYALLVFLLVSLIPFLPLIPQVSADVYYYYAASGRIFTIPTYGTAIGFDSDKIFTTAYRENDYWYFTDASGTTGFQVEDGNLTITDFFEASNHLLDFNVSRGVGQSITRVNATTRGNATSISGATSWDYTAATQILEINVTHTSDQQVQVDWTETGGSSNSVPENGNFFYGDSVTVMSLNNAAYKYSIRFTSFYSQTITQIRFSIVKSGTPPTYRFGIQTDNSGDPSGSWVNYVDNAPTSSGWHIVNITDSALSVDTVYHLVVEAVGAPSGSNHIRMVESQPYMNFIPFNRTMDTNLRALQDYGSGWSERSSSTPIWILDVIGGNYYGNPYATAVEEEAFYGSIYMGQYFNMTTGLTMKKNFVSFRIRKSGAPADSVYITVRNATDAETVIHEVFATAGEVSTSLSWIGHTFSSEVTLIAGKRYQIYLDSPGSLSTSNGYWMAEVQTGTTAEPYTSTGWRGTDSCYYKSGTFYPRNDASYVCLQNDLVTSGLSVNDTRINPSDGLIFSGYWYYQGTSTAPPDGDYQVKVTLDGVQKGSTDITLVSGLFNITDVTAESSVASYSYKVEAAFMDSEGTFSSVIVDRLMVTVAANTTTPLTGDTVGFTVSAKYQYDNTDVSTLSFQATRNGTNFASSTPFTDTNASVVVYQYTVSSANETTYDLNTFTTNTETVKWGYGFTFYGVYNETTGLRNLSWNVTVTSFFIGNNTDTFYLNGTYTYQPSTMPLYFHFDLQVDREYWLSAGEISGSIYVFNDTFSAYDIEFLDLAGVLNEYSFIEAQYYVNGTLRTVEKRKADAQNKIQMSLVNGRKYNLVIRDGSSYTFGDLLMTSDLTVTLTLKALAFPDHILLGYQYVRIWVTRNMTLGTEITINYQDLTENTTLVYAGLYFLNGTLAWETYQSTDSFIVTWNGLNNETDYYISGTITHVIFGSMSFNQALPGLLSSSNPFGLSVLGTLPFNTAYLIPAFIMLCVAAVFSALNVPAGLFSTIIVAILFAYLQWLPIHIDVLIFVFALVVIFAVGWGRRRISTL